MAEERPELTFDQLNVGQCYVDRHIAVTAEIVDAYCAAIGTANPLYRDRGATQGVAESIAPPSLLTMWTPPRVCFDDWRIPQGGIHTSQEWESRRPVRPGEVLRQRVHARDKYLRNERRYVVLETRFENASGELVAKGSMTLIWQK